MKKSCFVYSILPGTLLAGILCFGWRLTVSAERYVGEYAFVQEETEDAIHQ